MIEITRLNDTHVIINAELIEFIEAMPNTLITLIDGKKLTAKETVDEVMDKIIDYKQAIFRSFPLQNKAKADLQGKRIEPNAKSLADWIESEDEEDHDK